MITAVPTDIPLTDTEDGPVVPIVAMPVLELLHVPPGGPSDKVVVPPTHIDGVPLIAEGVMFTIIEDVAKQPVDNV